jgi:hypothetical protein
MTGISSFTSACNTSINSTTGYFQDVPYCGPGKSDFEIGFNLLCHCFGIFNNYYISHYPFPISTDEFYAVCNQWPLSPYIKSAQNISLPLPLGSNVTFQCLMPGGFVKGGLAFNTTCVANSTSTMDGTWTDLPYCGPGNKYQRTHTYWIICGCFNYFL